MPRAFNGFRTTYYKYLLFFYVVSVSLSLGAGSQLTPENNFSRLQSYDEENQVQILSQCGRSWDADPVEKPSNSLLVSKEYIERHSPAAASNGGCSGTLITNDLYITAGHCSNPSKVRFFYQNDPNGNPRETKTYQVAEVLEDGLGGLDYKIVRLRGNPGDEIQPTPIADGNCANGDILTIIGHPKGRPKEVSTGRQNSLSGMKIFYKDLDTEPGNSGSGILCKGKFVGVHTHGGCSSNGGSNSGSSMSGLFAVSQVLRDLRDEQKLSITKQPLALSVPAGSTASLAVEANGNNLTYQWHSNEGPISGKTKANMTLENFQQANTSMYWVEVKSGSNSLLSDKVLAKTDDMGDLQIKQQPLSTSFILGSEGRLKIEAIGVGELTYQWFQDGKTLENQNTDTLIINSTTQDNAGVYTVAVSDLVSSIESEEATVSVQETTEIVIAARKTIGALNDPSSLEMILIVGTSEAQNRCPLSTATVSCTFTVIKEDFDQDLSIKVVKVN